MDNMSASGLFLPAHLHLAHTCLDSRTLKESQTQTRQFTQLGKLYNSGLCKGAGKESHHIYVTHQAEPPFIMFMLFTCIVLGRAAGKDGSTKVCNLSKIGTCERDTAAHASQ